MVEVAEQESAPSNRTPSAMLRGVDIIHFIVGFQGFGGVAEVEQAVPYVEAYRNVFGGKSFGAAVALKRKLVLAQSTVASCGVGDVPEVIGSEQVEFQIVVDSRLIVFETLIAETAFLNERSIYVGIKFHNAREAVDSFVIVLIFHAILADNAEGISIVENRSNDGDFAEVERGAERVVELTVIFVELGEAE